LVVGDRGGEEGVLDVERWAELRREHFVGGVSIKELARRHGIDRNTVRRALRSDAPPIYQRASASKLDPFKDEIHRLLKADPKLPGQRIRELIAPLGFDGGKTIVDELPARGQAAVRAATEDVSAHRLPAR
jgi:transposase